VREALNPSRTPTRRKARGAQPRTTPHHYRDVVGTTVSDSRSGRALTRQQSKHTTRVPHAPGAADAGVARTTGVTRRRLAPPRIVGVTRRRLAPPESPGTAWNRLEPCDIAVCHIAATQPPDARRFGRAAPPLACTLAASRTPAYPMASAGPIASAVRRCVFLSHRCRGALRQPRAGTPAVPRRRLVVLAIETSCDDTSAAVVTSSRCVRACASIPLDRCR
jgi:hypothetical protein